jgi:hypothetical protein
VQELVGLSVHESTGICLPGVSGPWYYDAPARTDMTFRLGPGIRGVDGGQSRSLAGPDGPTRLQDLPIRGRVPWLHLICCGYCDCERE